MNSSSLKWVLGFFSVCLPSVLTFLKPHVFMHAHVLKMISAISWCLQKNPLHSSSHSPACCSQACTTSCVSLSSALSWTLIYRILVSVPHTQRQREGVQYFFSGYICASSVQRLACYSSFFFSPCIFLNHTHGYEGVHVEESLYHGESLSFCCITQSPNHF